MQTGLGSPKHTDAALWSCWFVTLYSFIAKVGFCRKPAFYLPVAGSRAPEMAL
jgi:hypothetical protein